MYIWCNTFILLTGVKKKIKIQKTLAWGWEEHSHEYTFLEKN